MFMRSQDSQDPNHDFRQNFRNSQTNYVQDHPPANEVLVKPVMGPVETVIGDDLTIIGNVISKGVVRLEGVITGDMTCASFVVEKGGVVKGNISAGEVHVHGRIEGEVHCQTIKLHSTAIVEGDIFHKGIGVEMGAQYDGRLKWIKEDEAVKSDKINSDDSDLFLEAAE